MTSPSEKPFEGFHYVRVAQARAREAALCESALPVTARLILLILAEVQVNGCCPMGPDAWGPALGVTADEADTLIEDLMDVGFLINGSDRYCLHVNGRAVDKGMSRGRHGCGQSAANSSRRKARPKASRYIELIRTGQPFRAPSTRALSA